MAEILIGTCGFSYNEWVGQVYPEGAKREQFLSLYAERFGTVELDYTYYSMPKAQNIRRMTEEAPALTFAIKAHQTLTHKIDSAKWKDEAKTYIQAIEPLRELERLEAVLFQFPYSFHYKEENRRYLGHLFDEFSGIKSAVEFRNAEWLNNRVIDGLKKRDIPLVGLDMPELKGLPPTMDVVTSPLAYFRLHGRNKETWWGSDGAARYDYLYSDKELEAVAQRIRQIVIKADRLLIYFNNHRCGQAVKNAETLQKILAKAGLIKPESEKAGLINERSVGNSSS
ncbi:MAG: DUF72 domain-containing protein [Treponema sp.]|jgi:uncharacterized protein YecE (DUF72 family)|nr:DUF72 domain-containing protein [Treponema sp.]